MVSSASAYSEAGESRVYTYNRYTVEYKIVNEWTGNQNIEITVTNTGDEILADWAMGYNASGEINGLWNAQIYGQQGTEYILSCASYNSEIVPGDSVNFGYTLTGDSFKFPQNIDTCDENIIAMYHITADDRVMGSVSSAKNLLQTVQNSKYTTRDEEEINRIYVSLLCPNSDKVIDPDSYAAQLVEASGGIIYTAVEEKMEIQPVLFAAAQTSVYAADSESEEPLIKPGSFADTVRKNVTGILGEGNGCEYQVISSTGLTTIKLDKPLTKGSKTDTDYDGLSDWDEVNTDLIIKMYAEKHSDYNWLKYGKWQMPTSTLPTFGELYYTYDKLFYVQNGL